MPKSNLAILRIEKNWTQEYVALKIGITKQAYSNIETGKRKPSYTVIVKLQKLFHKSIDHLLEKESDNNITTK